MSRFLITVFYHLSAILIYCSCDENTNTFHPECEGGGHGNGPPPSGTNPGPGGTNPGPGGTNPGPGGTNPGPGGTHPGPGSTPNQPGGSLGGMHDGKFTVVISFDSLDKSSQRFFINQLKPSFGELSKCVYWHFIPCSTSHIVQDVLECKDGVAECQIDVLHACAAHFYENDQGKLGSFFLCMMTDENQYVKGEGCAKQAGMDWCRLNNCQPKTDAGEFCDNRYKQLNSLHETNIPGVMFNFKANEKLDHAAVIDFKGTVCSQLKKNNMKCDACGSSGSGDGHGPGGNEHGPGSGPPPP